MIFEALELIRSELAAYLAQGHATGLDVALGGIASAAGPHTDQVLLSLVSVEEDTAHRNSSPYQRRPPGGGEVPAPVFLNLLVLVAANFDSNATYGTALRRLAEVVQCFRQKSELSVAHTPAATAGAAGGGQLHVVLDLAPLPFEQLSQLWATLGGRQVPCVLYKARVVAEPADERPAPGPVIGRGQSRMGTLEPQFS